MDLDTLRKGIRSQIKTEEIEVPGIGKVWVRELPAMTIMRFAREEGSKLTPDEASEQAVDAIIAGSIDAEGNPLFSDTPDYRATLKELNNDQLNAWFSPILRLSGIEEELDEGKD